MLARDLPAIVVATILLTITAVVLLFAVSGGWRRNLQLLVSAALSSSYAIRMIVQLELVRRMDGATAWQPYADSVLQYLVPTAGTALFSYTYTTRFRRLNDVLFAAFVALALFAIPYEIAMHQPYRFSGIVNALVVILIFVWGGNLVVTIPNRDDLRPLRISSAVFAIAVANEHWRWVPRPDGINLEPVGFLVFMAAIVYDLLRRAIRDQTRLASVNSELATARSMQQAVLPDRAPDVRGLDVASVYRPSAQVGGDFFDYVPDGSGRLGIFIADVAGHGVPAALVASMLKIALAAEQAGSPAAILGRLNRLFLGRLHRQFFTAALARIDVGESTMTIASGGHPPAIVLPPDQERAQEIAVPGFVLGRMPDASFQESSLRFAPGAIAILYTDGIIEATNRSGEIFGYERLARCLESSRGADAARVADAIMRDVDRWTVGSRAEGDDLTLVVVRAVQKERGGSRLPQATERASTRSVRQR